jgi:hypothetical protein
MMNLRNALENEEAMTACELVIDGFKPDEKNFRRFTKAYGSVANSLSISVTFERYHSECYNPEEDKFYRGTQYYARIQMHRGSWDGDDIEYENTIDVHVKADKVMDTLKAFHDMGL